MQMKTVLVRPRSCECLCSLLLLLQLPHTASTGIIRCVVARKPSSLTTSVSPRFSCAHNLPQRSALFDFVSERRTDVTNQAAFQLRSVHCWFSTLLYVFQLWTKALLVRCVRFCASGLGIGRRGWEAPFLPP